MSRRARYHHRDPADLVQDPARELHPTMPEPDWARYVMPSQTPNANMPPVGDPTRWGASLDTNLPIAGIDFSTAQVLQVQTKDAYSRSWSLFGTLSLPQVLWLLGTGAYVAIDVAQGVGQTVINQRIPLFAGAVAAGSTFASLCEAQWINNGGVYDQITLPPQNGLTMIGRSFACVGALVGQSISVSVHYSIAVAWAANPAISSLGLVVAPYAAGDKL
jgi:hypothetical protein